MKPTAYPCESCGEDITQLPGRGRIRKHCMECRPGYHPVPKRTHCTECGSALERAGSLQCPDCKPAKTPRPRNPYGHKVTCSCSDECREHRNAYAREWKRRNPDRGRYEKPEQRRARDRKWNAENPEKRRASRMRWNDENPAKVRALGRATYRRNPERALAATRAWTERNREYVGELQRAWKEDRARVVTPRAVNGRQPWTEAELRIALDPTRTLTEAALMLGRTVNAVGQKRWHSRRDVS